MIIKNKHGTEKIISIYWFAILIIIAGAVVAMVVASNNDISNII